MMSKKIVSLLTAIVICSLLLSAGCTQDLKEAEEPKIVVEEEKPKVVEEEKPKVVEEEEKPKVVEEEKPAAELTLKYTPNDSTTYTLITEAVRKINWEGLYPNDTAFRGGQTSSRNEITFTRQIQSTDDKGNAVAVITIKSLKHISIVRDNPVLDFDSSREKDQDSPLAKLIGQSYTVEITPAGRLSKIIDANQAQTAVGGSTSADKTAAALVSNEVITERHSIPAMPPPDKSRVKAGDNWSSVKTLSFGLMGTQTYDRVYTLKEIKETDKLRIATVEMKAVPTTEGADELHKEKSIGDFSKMFENTETYTGELRLNMTAGKVEKCLERLNSEWIAIDPSAAQKEEKEPAILKMTAIRLYHLEKTD